MTQGKKLDFGGQSIFCGIDVHKKSWSVCLRTADRELQCYTQNPDPELLSDRLNKSYPGASIQLVYEAGFSGYWTQQKLSCRGFDCRIVHASDVPQTDKNRRFKTDPADCRKLAWELSKGSLNFIHIPQPITIENRSLVRSREQLVKDQTRYKNRIHSFLDFMGVAVPENFTKSTHFSRAFLKWLEQLDLPGHSRAALKVKLSMLEAIRGQLLEVNRVLKALAKSDAYQKQMGLLMTIPGIGWLSALIIFTELEDIRRFKNFDHLASYVGFKPDIYASAEKSSVKGITHHCNHLLRETMVECAWMAISKDPALTQSYYQLKGRMHYNKAILRIAKKLLNRVRFVLINEQPYQIETVS
ncbi:IS110 family transposase [Flavihumibacter petaseus]|uniref:Putative transposase n=1 Tax=Flavihumibacter petaseus NBRC 106054 TaxID=1220578 RepID=A0A0E9MUC0_9BACT|nr:IS110 family transposase [Flavihumibacter petaseus]GAO41011.1 putative transposase [Flavihumibacter petaseus NBRC 106054]